MSPSFGTGMGLLNCIVDKQLNREDEAFLHLGELFGTPFHSFYLNRKGITYFLLMPYNLSLQIRVAGLSSLISPTNLKKKKSN